ncbi:MAG: CRP-like cAMP-binding protein [Sulfurimonas sp.]|jgi:CRP-like cAMP-binding protein|uniref:Crp/Fnr family transcriptional regulator n=1 Tax=Sulfurimonas sp. TaxID=2022749 RepID=UPI0039E4C6D6
MKHTSITNMLKELYLFSSMDNDELERLTEISSVHNYKKDEHVFMQGELGHHLLIVVEGIVSVFKHDNKGNEIIISFFKPFSLLGEAAILKGVTFPSTAVCKSDGVILKIEFKKFKELFMHDPHISFEIIQSLLDKIQLLQQNIHFTIAKTAKEKVLHFYANNKDLSLELKKYEIASLLGMNAETLSRNIKKLIKEGKLLKVDNRYKLL